MRTIVEVLVASIGDSQVSYTARMKELRDGEIPDEAAHRIVERVLGKTSAEIADHVLIHSTNWRYSHDMIVLTYLAYTDELAFDATSSIPLQEILSNAVAPVSCPTSTAEMQIVCHAIHYLAFLTRYSSQSRRFLSVRTMQLLKSMPSALPEEL